MLSSAKRISAADARSVGKELTIECCCAGISIRRKAIAKGSFADCLDPELSPDRVTDIAERLPGECHGFRITVPEDVAIVEQLLPKQFHAFMIDCSRQDGHSAACFHENDRRCIPLSEDLRC